MNEMSKIEQAVKILRATPYAHAFRAVRTRYADQLELAALGLVGHDETEAAEWLAELIIKAAQADEDEAADEYATMRREAQFRKGL